MKLRERKHHIVAAIGLLILFGFAISNAVGQVTTQETGPSAINITTNDVINVDDTEATFQATLEKFNDTTYDAVLIYWNYSKDGSLDQPGPMTVETTERQRSVIQTNLDSNSQYNYEAYAEPIKWDDPTLLKNYQEVISRSSRVGSFSNDLGGSYSVDQSISTTCTKDIYVSHDGSKMAILCNDGQVNVYNMSEPWDLTNSSKISSYSGALGYREGLEFSTEGKKVFVSSLSGDIRSYNLDEPWNVSSASESGYFKASYASGLTISPDGRNLKVINQPGSSSPGLIESYSFQDPWNLSTANIVRESIIDDGDGTDIDFTDDGTQAAIISQYGDPYVLRVDNYWGSNFRLDAQHSVNGEHYAVEVKASNSAIFVINSEDNEIERIVE